MKMSTEIITLHGQSICINSFWLYTHYSYNGNKVVKNVPSILLDYVLSQITNKKTLKHLLLNHQYSITK